MPTEADPSATHSQNNATLDRGECREDRRHERSQILNTVGRGANEDDTERQYGYALLEPDIPVHCNEDIIVTPHAAQQFAVLDACPAAAGHSVYGMTAQFRCEVDG